MTGMATGAGLGSRARITGHGCRASGVALWRKAATCAPRRHGYGFLEPRRGSVGAYLQAVQGARAGTRRVAWRLLSRVNRAFSSGNLA